MMCLPFRLDPPGTSDSDAAATGWRLPGGSWLVPVTIVGTLVIASGSNAVSGLSIKTEPANGHHYVAAYVVSAPEDLAA